ncbi:hypothetical protein [Propionivibrio sp.]|uniref:hypothetical protein n=1 Tax=Propionivibrio sp. TaxID=2212460 RepID=UPI003BF0E8EE
MITLAQPLPTGNATRLMLNPPAGATRCVLLRKTADTFTAWNDTGAVVVYDGPPERAVLDWSGLVNGIPYFYVLYSLVAAVWQASASRSVTPAAIDSDLSVDVLSIVRERIDLGLQVEVTRGNLNNKNGRIQVLTAPPLYDNLAWPVVTVHVNSDSSSDRALGEMMAEDVFNSDSFEWESSEGWLSKWSIGISGWSLNPDERIALRKAIKRIVLGNLPIFNDAGMMMIDLSQQDAEDFERYSAPVYQINGTLTCTAMSLNSALEGAIRVVEITQIP